MGKREVAYAEFGINCSIANYDGFPSKGISEAVGVEIYTDWKLPYDRVKMNKDVCYNSKSAKAYEKLWDEFVMLNPCIINWVTASDYESSLKQKITIMMGMISMFNEDDIRDYLVCTGWGRSEEYEDLRLEIECMMRLCMAWVPSTKTLNFLKEELTKKQQA